MSYPQFGYPYGTTSQLLVSSSGGGEAGSARPSASDYSTPSGAVCCAPYDGRLLATARGDLATSAAAAAALSVYGGSYATQTYGNYVPYGTEPSAFYSTLTSPYDIKDNGASLHGSLGQTTSYYPYDPTISHYQYSRYGGVDLSAGTRRKNATRETTSTLKAWLYEHRKNPYPTKGEKIMLAIITKMTLTQVSTWFANARRRLKKENKMTWSPRSRPGEESKERGRGEDENGVKSESGPCYSTEPNGLKEEKEPMLSDLDELEEVHSENLDEVEDVEAPLDGSFGKTSQSHEPGLCKIFPGLSDSGPDLERSKGVFPLACMEQPQELRPQTLYEAHSDLSTKEKPKIWSLAHTANEASALKYPPCAVAPASALPSSGLGLPSLTARTTPFHGLPAWTHGGLPSADLLLKAEHGALPYPSDVEPRPSCQVLRSGVPAGTGAGKVPIVAPVQHIQHGDGGTMRSKLAGNIRFGCTSFWADTVNLPN